MVTASDSPHPQAGRRRGAGAVLLALASFTYIPFWVVALTVWSGSLSIQLSSEGAVALYGSAPLRATLNVIFSEGLPAISLLIVLVAVAFTVRRSGAAGAGLIVLVAGVAAVVVSLVECALGLLLTLVAAPAHDASLAGLLFGSLTRLDGVKMLLLAAAALAASVGPAWRLRALPVWLRVIGVALAVAIVISGVGYAFLIPPLAIAAWASLPLLLVWVTGSGLVLTWRAMRS